jgi:hypothetical protein
MKELVLELTPNLYERLENQAKRVGKSAQVVAQDWLVERLAWPPPAPRGERERAVEALRTAGLLTELSPAEKQQAARNTATLEEVRAALDKAGGPPLSALILEMRGPKE